MTLPYDFKDVYDLRIESSGRSRFLVGQNRRLYDRRRLDQSANYDPTAYDLFTKGDQGALTITPTPSTATILRLRYYRRMWVPCPAKTLTFTGTAPLEWLYNGSSIATSNTITSTNPVEYAGITLGSPVTGVDTVTNAIQLSTPVLATRIYTSGSRYCMDLTLAGMGSGGALSGSIVVGGDNYLLDIPEDYEDGILARATAHFLAGLGTPSDRLSYFMQKAEDEFNEARRANEEFEDNDIAFEVGNGFLGGMYRWFI